MELAKLPQPQETLPRQTSASSALLPTYAGIGAVSLPAQAVFGHVALLSFCLFQPLQSSSAKNRESGAASRGEAVVFSCLFQLRPERHRESYPVAERRRASPGGWP